MIALLDVFSDRFLGSSILSLMSVDKLGYSSLPFKVTTPSPPQTIYDCNEEKICRHLELILSALGTDRNSFGQQNVGVTKYLKCSLFFLPHQHCVFTQQ